MAPYNPQWEAQIEGFRKNRRLLVARNIPFNATRAAFETDLRTMLTRPSSVNFLWPPPSSAEFNNPARHSGWVMLAFNQRPDVKTAEANLKEYKFRGRQIKIERASRVAYPPRSSGTRAAAPATAALTIVAPMTTAPATAATNSFGHHVQPSSAQHIAAAFAPLNPFGSFKETALMPRDVPRRGGDKILDEEDENKE